ncbi:Transcription initiation factor TFIID subunit 1 [Hondaea fermentalgiana]|uniref:Transcription initiation factor TFIID subunit 1 n=1 Tax=Hondaea fermentalgiana TaxID=2315210 RepID=A0A2R5GEB1_9STRA|nr:Transcription initiation factor TFIID subunit 1 [Hondaea fermentalgiana]|eukprot:GBG29280.1 Transcription initiation factor TFIID subunit 1 [Hondaea fermentalgiana]
MSKLSEDEVKELGNQELARFPKLVDDSGEPVLRFSALLPSEAGQQHPLVPADKVIKRNRREVKVNEETWEHDALEKAQVLCHSVGFSLLGTPAEQLPIGHVIEEDLSDDDSDSDNSSFAERADAKQIKPLESLANGHASSKGTPGSANGHMDASTSAAASTKISQGNKAFSEESSITSCTDLLEMPTKRDSVVAAIDTAWENSISWGDDEEDTAGSETSGNDSKNASSSTAIVSKSTSVSAQPISISSLDSKNISVPPAKPDVAAVSPSASQDAKKSGASSPRSPKINIPKIVLSKSKGSPTSPVQPQQQQQLSSAPPPPPPPLPSSSKNPDAMDVDDSDDDDDFDVEWSSSGPAGAGAGATGGSMSMTTGSNAQIFQVSMPTQTLGTSSNWGVFADEMENPPPRVSATELAVSQYLRTPMNQELASCMWLEQICWDEDLLDKRVVIDASFGAPLVVSANDTGCLTRDEIVEAYGNDVRPGAVLAREAMVVEKKKKEVFEKSAMGLKQLKKISKDERRTKLRENGYFRFIDEKNESNTEMGRGISERLRCRRLPQIPKEVIVQEYKAELKAADARRLHRPEVVVNPEVPLQVGKHTIFHAGIDGGIRQNRKNWTRADISGSTGAICLFEYMEERPPLLCNVGMASMLCNFYQADKPTDESFIPPTPPGHGRPVVLQPGDRSPFFAILRPKEMYPAIVNDLIVAPVCEHKVSKTDFLLVRPKRKGSSSTGAGADGAGSKEDVYIRNIKSLYLVGQTEPQREVFHPGTAETRANKRAKMREFLDWFVDYQVIRRFNREQRKRNSQVEPRKRNNLVQVAMDSKTFEHMFSLIAPAVVQKSLKRVAHVNRGRVVLNTSEAANLNDLREKISGPGMCQYESLQAGLQRLRDRSIELTSMCEVTRVMHAQAVLMDFYHLKERAGFALKEAVLSGGTHGVVPGSQHEREIARKHNVLSPTAQQELRAAQFIVDELQLTPWYLTQSYINNKAAEQPRLKLIGLGEPSGRHEAISYLPESIEGSIRKGARNKFRHRMVAGAAATAAALSAVKAADAEDKQQDNNEKKKRSDRYGGTERDLRGLTLEVGAKILSLFGHEWEEIDLLDRWDRIMLVEEYASAYGGAANIPFLTKFARNAPKLTEKDIRERDVVQKRVNALFEKQIKAISQQQPPAYVLEEEKRRERKARKKEKRKRERAEKRKRKANGEDGQEEGEDDADGDDGEDGGKDDDADDEDDEDDENEEDEDEDEDDEAAENEEDEDGNPKSAKAKSSAKMEQEDEAILEDLDSDSDSDDSDDSDASSVDEGGAANVTEPGAAGSDAASTSKTNAAGVDAKADAKTDDKSGSKADDKEARKQAKAAKKAKKKAAKASASAAGTGPAATSGAASGANKASGAAAKDDDSDSDSDSSDDSDDGGANLDMFKASLAGPMQSSENLLDQKDGASGAAAGKKKGERMSDEERMLALFKQNITKRHMTDDDKQKNEAILKEAADRAKMRQIPANLPGQPPFRKQQVVRRTVIRNLPNGETEVSVEYIKAPELVKQVREDIRKRESLAEGSRRLTRPALDSKARNRAPPPPRVQERDRIEGKKRFEEYQANIRQYGKNWPSTVKAEGDQKRCRTCGLPGHVSNARICPLNHFELKDNDQVKMKGLKLKLPIAPSVPPVVGRISQRTGVKSFLQARKRQLGGKTEPSSKSAKRQKRGGNRRVGPVSDLSEKLMKVYQELYVMREAELFRKKVNKQAVPRYYDIIKKPMYLGKIKQKIEGLQYTSRAGFMEDLNLMLSNAATFNGNENEITRKARELVSTAENSMAKMSDVLAQLEQNIIDSGAAAPPPPSSSGSGAGSNKRRKVNSLFKAMPNPPTAAAAGGSSSSSSSSSTMAQQPKQQQQANLSSQSSMSFDPFADDDGPSATPGNDFFSGGPTPSPGPDMPRPSPSPGISFPMPSPSPGPGMTPLPAPSPAASELFNIDLENSDNVVEEEEEEEEIV